MFINVIDVCVFEAILKMYLLKKFADTEIEKSKFHQHKGPISINNIDTNKTVVSNMVSFGKKDFKYFLGYKDAKQVRPLYIFLPKMSTYIRNFDETKYMFFIDIN